ncbi:MAG: molecular chaperone GrpE, partial [Actinomycetota bacterium]|nr:molecular chaperone GrpE [Actinomycetota bacterium]
PVLDSFELAVRNLDGSDVDEKVRKGIDLVYAELIAVMERAGLQRIEAEDAPFDPNEHEAVLQDDGDGEPHVEDVLRTGWKLKGRVLRPAMVKVTRKKPE